MYPTWIRLNTKPKLLRRSLKYQDKGTLTKDIYDNKKHNVDIVKIYGHLVISDTNINHNMDMNSKMVQKHRPTTPIVTVK